MLDIYLKPLEMGYFEVGEAFKGLSDEHVWIRPAQKLLSIGETAGHIAYWDSVRLAGDGGASTDLSTCKVTSPLIDTRFRYYTSTLETSPSDEQLAMSAEQVGAELQRTHSEAVAVFKKLNPDMDSVPAGWAYGNTYGEWLTYLAFHIAYHTGQIYSVRHLLGETTPDN